MARNFEDVPQSLGVIEHEVVGLDGQKVVIRRDSRGRLLPGARLCELAPPVGRSIVNPASAIRKALGLPSHKRRSK